MTTKLKYETTPNVFVKNSVFNLTTVRTHPECVLSAIMISIFGSNHGIGHELALTSISKSVEQKLPNYRAGLLVTKSYVKPLNRTSMYYKLWRSIQKEDVETPAGRRTEEYMSETESHATFSGMLELSDRNYKKISLFMEKRAFYILYYDESVDAFARFISIDWGKREHLFFSGLIDSICGTSALLCTLFGTCDDHNSGCIMLGRPSLIDALTKDSHEVDDFRK